MVDLSKFVESLDGKAIYVYGLGQSGLSSVEALIQSGAKVYAWDAKEEQRTKAHDVGSEIADEDSIDYNLIGSLLLSPGIPLTHPEPHPVVTKAKEHDIEIVGDIEVLGRVLPDYIRTVGITGTNGKSTTTALLGHILSECNVNSMIAGNIGTPVLGLDIQEDLEVLVLEMSSYQIDLCPSFHPNIGILLNISPDHIDRHGSLDQYAAVKAKIFGHHTRPIISVDDQLSEEIFDVEAELGKAPVLLSTKGSLPFETDRLKTLAGKHNHQNALAAYYVCLQLELSHEDIINAMESFPGLAHRQEIVKVIGNISFINDSKATNAEATAKALSTYENIYWILGGQSKDGGLKGLEEYADKIKKAYLIGEAAEEFTAWCEGEKIPFDRSAELSKAVVNAYKDARNQGEPSIILLSPACASWDQFKSFEHRGDVFKDLVLNLDE